MVDAIVAAGAEAHVSGITAERVSTYLRTVGRNDLLAPDEAAMRLTPWEGFDAQGHPLRRKSTCLSKEQENRLVKATDEEPVRTYLTRKERLGQPVAGPLPWEYVRFTEEGRRVALENLLLEAHDTQALAARQFGFSDDAAEEYATWAVNYRLAEATRNLGKSDKESLDMLATTLLTNSLEKYLTRPVPSGTDTYPGAARLGRAFEGTNRVGADFMKFVGSLKPRNAKTEAALWDRCAHKCMDEALGTAWDAQFDKAKAKFGVEPIGYWEAFYDPYTPQSKGVTTPLNYQPAKENPERLAELRKLAASGDRQAMATVAAWDAAIKSAGSHNATLLSDGRSSVPFARNHVHRDIVLAYKPASMHVEGTRRGARYVFRYTDGLTYYRDGLAQFRSAPSVSLNKPVGTDDNATELGDLLAQSRGGSGAGRNYAGADEIYDAGQRYASASVIAAKLPDDDAGNEELRRLLDVDPHDGIKDKKARALAVARDITSARTENVPEDVIRRAWGPKLIEMTNAIAKARDVRIARAKDEAAAAKARLRTLAAQRRAAQAAR